MNSWKEMKYKSFLDIPNIFNAFKDVGLFSENNELYYKLDFTYLISFCDLKKKYSQHYY